MPGALIPHPPTSRRWRWYAWLGEDLLFATALLGGLVVGFASGILTHNFGVGFMCGFGYLLLDIAARRLLRRILRGSAEYQRLVTDKAGAAQLTAAREAVQRIENAWPNLGVLDEERPGPVLAGSLWDLAGDLLRRAELQDASATARQLLDDLADRDEPAKGALAERMDGLAAAEHRVDAAVTARVDTLVRLADACERQVIAQGTRVRLEELTRRTDSLLAADARLRGGESAPALAAGAEDPAAELAERTEAVLAAYRELREGAA